MTLILLLLAKRSAFRRGMADLFIYFCGFLSDETAPTHGNGPTVNVSDAHRFARRTFGEQDVTVIQATVEDERGYER